MSRTNQRTKQNGNGEGTCYFSESKQKWRASCFLPNGERKQLEQRKNETVTAFKNRFKKLQASILNGTYIDKSSDNLYSIINNHIEQKLSNGKIEEATFKRDLESLKTLEKICNKFIYMPIQKVSSRHIESITKDMRKYSKSQIDKLWRLLKKGFKIAYSRHLIPYNIMEDETLEKPIPENPPENKTALTLQEEQHLLEILNSNEYKDHKYTNIIKAQLASAMRISELLARSRRDIDIEKNTILINNTLTKDRKSKIILGKHTKTYDKKTGIDKGVRNLPLFPELKPLLLKELENKTTNIDGLLFWNYKENTFINPQNINKFLKNLNEKHKITTTPLTSHILRHTRITRWKEAGIDMKVIQYWAGHVEGSKITDDVYFTITEDFIKQQLEKIS